MPLPEKVLVTGAHTPAALAVTRSLGKNGIEVACAGPADNCLSFYSRHCKEKLVYPSPMDYPFNFVEFLSERVKCGEYYILVPVTDADMYLITKYAAEFLPYVKVAMNDHSTFLKVLDKSETIKIASGIKVPVPRTVMIDSPDKIREVADSLQYPAVIKPRQSVMLVQDKLRSGTTAYAFSPEELITRFREMHRNTPFPLVQELVTGDEKGIFVLVNRGKVKAVFAHRRLRSINPRGGASSLAESEEVDAEMRGYALGLLREINWEGVAMVEFKVDSRDNVPRLMEINGRFWGSLQLAVNAGVDFPYLLYRTLNGEFVEEVRHYRKGIRCRNMHNDLGYLLAVMRSKKRNPDSPSRLAAAFNFFKFYDRHMSYSDLSISDPGLSWKFITDVLALSFRFLKRR